MSVGACKLIWVKDAGGGPTCNTASRFMPGLHFLDNDHDGAVGTKTRVIRGWYALVCLAHRLREHPIRRHTRANQVLACPLRTLRRKLQIGIFMADTVGESEQPDVHRPAFPCRGDLIEHFPALVAYPGLVEAKFHHVLRRRINRWIGHLDLDALSAKPERGTSGIRSQTNPDVIGAVLHLRCAGARDHGGLA